MVHFGAVLAAGTACVAAAVSSGRGAVRPHELLQASEQARQSDTPIKRVVGLLKEMQATIDKEMQQDEALYKKLSCWCNNNEYEKNNVAEASGEKINELKASIDSLTARSTELNTQIKELESQVSSDKQALAEATAIREKQQKENHGAESDNIQAIENLKAALEVLAKHHTSTPAPWGQGEDSYGKPSDGWSFLATRSKDEPWTEAHEASHLTRILDDFMLRSGFDQHDSSSAETGSTIATQRFLQGPSHPRVASTTEDDAAVVRTALRSAAAFFQAHHGGGYFPSYQSRSGEIVGVLKQLKEEMEGDLSESQKLETSRVVAFEELRAAKSSEIAHGEKMAETKEDELATTNNDLAEAKEDLAQEEASLNETQKFLVNLGGTCAEADKNFEERKQARMDESKAVSETVQILTEDEARNVFSDTYSFLQVEMIDTQHQDVKRRRSVAAALRRTAVKTHDPQLAMLASTVELDAFTKVKKAIDHMVSMLKLQQADEVKKNDWCKASLHETEMTTAKTDDFKADLQAKEGKLESDIKTLEQGIANAKSQIQELHLSLQRASEYRLQENREFQTTISDQTTTVDVLVKALDRLASYYKEASLVQRGKREQQTPPVPQAEYTPSKGSTGVMQMIQKLIQAAKAMSADAKKAEGEAQAAYEQHVADTNDSVADLQKEVTTKTKNKAKATKDKLMTESDIADTVSELEGLSKYSNQLHAECDYLLKNFDVRQEARAQEIEALAQAKTILSGASLS